MDNAVEACEHMNNDNKWIHVTVGMYQEYLHLIVRNFHEGKLKLKSRKRDRNNHGFGLENLQKRVEKNDGKITVIAEKGIFEIDIIVKAFVEVE